MIKLFRLKMTILVLIASAVSSLAAGSTRNCTWCHGTSAQGLANAPRLAGQNPLYIENQLLSFFVHARDNPFSAQYMWAASAGLNAETAHDLAVYFSMLPAEPALDGNKELIAIGRMIYEEGNPETDLAACAACHGPNAEGVRQIPRLGGLSYSYLKRRLEEWGQGYHASAQPPMPRIASKLSPEEIEALASFLSFVP
jgi:cytochrome c553